jgi:riboflavin transporter FmnP
MMAKSVLALIVGLSLVVAGVLVYRRNRSATAVLALLAPACFLVVATAHVFEAFELLPSFGWGQPASVGHYIDLGAAIIGTALTVVAFALMFVRRPSR